MGLAVIVGVMLISYCGGYALRVGLWLALAGFYGAT